MSNHSSIVSKIELAHGVLSGMSTRAAARRAGVCNTTGMHLLASLGDRCAEMLRRTPVVANTHQVERAGEYHVALAIERSSLLVVAFGVDRAEGTAISAAGAAGTTASKLVPFVRIPRVQARGDFVRYMTALWSCYWNFCHVSEGATIPVVVNVSANVIGALEQRRAEGEPVESVAVRVLGDALGFSTKVVEVSGTPAMRCKMLKGAQTLARLVADAFDTPVPQTFAFPDAPRTVKAIAEAAGCSPGTVRRDLQKGVAVEEIVTRKTLKNASLGTRHERLTVKVIDRSCQPNVMAIVDCDCGTKRKAVELRHVLSGRVTSCGCAHLEALSQGKAPTHVDLFGHSVPIGVLADIAGIKPVALWSRMRRGLTAEEAAFGKVSA